MTVDYQSKQEVRNASIELRKKHNALDWTARVDDLIKLEGLEQTRYSPWTDRWSLASVIQASAKNVKALISVKDQLILISSDLHQAKEAFAKGHELGHSTLPWHREILYVCDEHDLSQSTINQMEWEANQFSSELLLPVPLLQQVYGQYPTSMETVLLLRDWSGASIESSAIAYAVNHPGLCVFLSLVEEVSSDGPPLLSIKNKAVSQPASKSILGSLERRQTFPREHVLYTCSRSDKIVSNTIRMTGDLSGRAYRCSVLNNQYRVLALITADD